RADGTVKVLDFGLAKAMDPLAASGAGALANSPTITSPAALSKAGVILGTAAYMAPEQARGRAVDKRGDIWPVGVIVCETMTGLRALPGEEASAALAAVMREEIALTAAPAAMPPRLRALPHDCLARDPRQRVRDSGDARRVLEQSVDDPADAADSPA